MKKTHISQRAGEIEGCKQFSSGGGVELKVGKGSSTISLFERLMKPYAKRGGPLEPR